MATRRKKTLVDLKVERAKTADLIPYINNARTHSEEQISQIAASIKEFGFLNPIILGGDNDILAGHGRLLGARKLGMEEVPIINAAHLNETQKKAFILADNKIGDNSSWDYELLGVELEFLSNADMAELTGFSLDDIADILGEENEENEGNSGNQDTGADQFLIIVECVDESEQSQLYDELKERGLSIKVTN